MEVDRLKYAVLQTGGKQYTVTEGDSIRVEKLDAEPGAVVDLDQVLLIGGDETKVGTPLVEGAKVTAEVVKTGKGKKIIVFKYKAKKNYRKKQGHRQPYTELKITSIVG